MQAEPLIQWPEPILQFIGFIAQFLAAGAIGFRYFAMRGRRIETDRAFYDDAARRAAMLGLLGVLASLVLGALSLPGLAARRHLPAGALLTSAPATMLQFGFYALAVIGYAMASGR